MPGAEPASGSDGARAASRLPERELLRRDPDEQWPDEQWHDSVLLAITPPRPRGGRHASSVPLSTTTGEVRAVDGPGRARREPTDGFQRPPLHTWGSDPAARAGYSDEVTEAVRAARPLVQAFVRGEMSGEEFLRRVRQR